MESGLISGRGLKTGVYKYVKLTRGYYIQNPIHKNSQEFGWNVSFKHENCGMERGQKGWWFQNVI